MPVTAPSWPSPAVESLDDFEAAERLRLERVEQRAMPIAFSATVVMVVTGLVTDRFWLLQTSGIGAVGFFVSYLLVRRGSVRAAALGFVITAVALVTNAGVTGSAGLRDPAVLAYPVIIIFAGMTLKPRSYLVALAFVASSAVVVALDHLYGWVPSVEVSVSSAIDAIIVTVILAATAYAVWLLAASSTGSLSAAYSEIQRRRESEDEFKNLAVHDPLTGVFNRRYFDGEMSRLASARHYPVSIIVADVDDLKTINDDRGHAAGDAALIQAARVLSTIVRVEDVLARIGGDEFAILLPNTDEAAANDAANRIERRLIDQLPDETGFRVSMSIGAATSIGEELDATLALADSRMYVDKGAKSKVSLR
ncbi:MAG: GGDEF domain-containing protein [Coriobacteriia bacterium]|nr:GGDEF domain-containing protein [Coriobacteriia bacterium]